MEQTKILVSAEVLEGLEAVRGSGKTNMFDRPRVIELAFEMGYEETGFWVQENRKQYAEGIFRGFASAESLSNRDSSRHDAQDDASGQALGKLSETDNIHQGGDK